MHKARFGAVLASSALLAAMIVSTPLATVQAADTRDPLEGTWLLNVAKSTFTPAPGLKGQMRTYSITDGLEKMTARGINSDGKPTLVQYQARYDGKDYDIIGSSGGNKISLKRIDPLTTESSQKRDGKLAIVATRHVSSDGKTLTVETKGTLPDGRMMQATMVFQRQP
jgi:hypothetical protein